LKRGKGAEPLVKIGKRKSGRAPAQRRVARAAGRGRRRRGLHHMRRPCIPLARPWVRPLRRRPARPCPAPAFPNFTSRRARGTGRVTAGQRGRGRAHRCARLPARPEVRVCGGSAAPRAAFHAPAGVSTAETHPPERKPAHRVRRCWCRRRVLQHRVRWASRVVALPRPRALARRDTWGGVCAYAGVSGVYSAAKGRDGANMATAVSSDVRVCVCRAKAAPFTLNAGGGHMLAHSCWGGHRLLK